ncbi:MAG: endolytic transglycosylase MltG [Bdellovibrionota bacterium]|nr:endolytic transglycosylase MltG [Bdellovibrionota bacterium]
MKKNLFIFLFLAPLLAIVLSGAKFYYHLGGWSYEGASTEFVVKPGETFSKINYRLKKKGLISNPKIFYRYCQFKGLLTKFKSGNFLIKKGSSSLDIIENLLKGANIAPKLTIPEGKNIYEIGKMLEKRKICSYKEFIRATKDKDLVFSFGIPGKTLEGYLYPDTYRFNEQTPPKQVISVMVKQFFRRWKSLGLNVSIEKRHDLIILASIIEKETGASFERPTISGVFHNRLKKRMRLQSDPTTIYGIYESFTGNLRKKHLLQKTPYNTYKVFGLPLGPISNPGLESIKAAINPKKHNYLYFVSKNDGTHKFSKKKSC